MSDWLQAACCVLWRGGGSERQIYLVERAKHLEFVGGFYAFVGGGVDDVDAAPAFDADPTRSRYLSAALRELFEETGVLALRGAERLGAGVRTQFRRRLVDQREPGAWLELLRGYALSAEPSRLVQLGLWRTPAYHPMRYEAPYFAVELPGGAEPEVWPGELVSGAWFTTSEALSRHDRGEVHISYPVLETLRVLERAGGALDAAATVLNDPTFAPYTHGGGEMLAGAHLLPVRTFTLPPATHTNCYVLGGRDLVVVDPATPIDDEQERLLGYLEYLAGKGGALREIWLTHHHKDHVGAVERVRRAFNVPVRAHPLTARALEGAIAVDGLIHDGDVMGVVLDDTRVAQWTALHTPGHAPGHLCFYERHSKALITGDNVLGLGTVLIAPPEGDMAQYLDSLRRLLTLDLGMMLPAHGPTVAATRERIEFYIAHRLQREARVLEAVQRGAASPAEIVRAVYTDVDPAAHGLAEINVRAHLHKLAAEQRVRQDGERFVAMS